MGYQELVAGLRKRAEETIHSLRKEAEAEIERLKEDASKEITMLRMTFESLRIRSSNEIREGIIKEARRKEMEIRLNAEEAISKRLFELALNSLRMLRDEDYDVVFSMLIKEIPAQGWKKIKVNPEDLNMVKGYFRDAELISDDKIDGGLIALTSDDRICVINTFEKRLERAWDNLLPLMIGDIYETIFNRSS